jgi:hypothetical protein
LLTITRRMALQLKSVMRRAFGSRNATPAVCFTASAGTLSVKAKSGEIAVEHRTPTDASDETLWLPFQLLADCEAKRDEPVELEAAGPGRAIARWQDKGVPQVIAYDAQPPVDADKVPGLPESFAENPPRLLKALVDAYDTTDTYSVRYATDCIQLRGQAKTNGQARNGTDRKPEQQDLDSLIQQTEILRTALRETLTKTNDLMQGLKRHRRQSRVLQATLANLRELKSLGV